MADSDRLEDEATPRAQRNLALSDICAVIDALEQDARQELLAWYCDAQLREYRRIFKPGEEVGVPLAPSDAMQAGQLDNIPRRFAWIQRALRRFCADHDAAFPQQWRARDALAAAFMVATR